MLGQQRPLGGRSRLQRTLDRSSAARRPAEGRRQGQRERGRLLGCGPRDRGGRVPRPEVSGGAAVRPEPAAGRGDEPRAVPRSLAEWRATHGRPGIPASAHRSRLVRGPQCEVAREHQRAGGPLSRQVPGELVPHAAGRDDRRRAEVDRERHHSHAGEIGHRPRDPHGRHVQDHGLRPHRRHAAQIRRGQDRRRSLAGRDPRHLPRQVRLEALHLRMEGREHGRAHPRLPSDGRQWRGAAYRRGAREQEDVPGG